MNLQSLWGCCISCHGTLFAKFLPARSKLQQCQGL